MKIIILLFLYLLIVSNSPVWAISDPREKPNNTFGVGVLSPEADIDEASKLVNNNGDWGWIVVVIGKNERDVGRWQTVLNKMNKNHLIPIIRIATNVDKNGIWQKPQDNDAQDWADFFSKLYFPTKNKYIQIYNEVNSAKEWGGSANAYEYANEFSKTADALRSKNNDIFILEAPLDLALKTGNGSLDAGSFFKDMNNAVPDIFLKIDGWASHSYPNPDFSANPLKSGRTGIDGYKWELGQISTYLKGKSLPVFITETGWKRSDDGKLDDKKISEYYKVAFGSVWKDKNIVAICPFIFSYPDDQFYQFAFKTKDSSADKMYFDYFFTILNFEKTKGNPDRINVASDPVENVPSTLINAAQTEMSFKIKNTGNYIWNTGTDLSFTASGTNLTISDTKWNKEEIYPGEEAVIIFKVQPSSEGQLPLSLKLLYKDQTITDRTISLNSLSYISFLLGTIKKISMGSIFYSSAKLISL